MTTTNFESLGIREIWQENERTLAISWTDGHQSKIDTVTLRRQCPCAVCVDEWTKERKLKKDDVPETVRPVRVSSVGRYAVNVVFSDNHSTGIYTYKTLRSLA